MPWQKRVADFFTAARAVLALALIWLGLVHGDQGIEAALVLLMLAATCDSLDGYFARLGGSTRQTWVGAHDLEFDLIFSVALVLYLTLADYLPAWVTVPYLGVWMAVFWNQSAVSNTLGVLFQAPIYAAILVAAVLHNERVVLWVAAWLGVMALFGGRRFLLLRLPGFWRDLQSRLGRPGGKKWQP